MKNIILSIFKQIKQRPILSFMNLIGLAGGVATCMLIFIYAHSELNFDSWVPNQDNLYRIEGNFVGNGFATSTMPPLKDAVLEEGSAFETAARSLGQNWPVKLGDFINYERVHIVDLEFLNMFPLNFLKGSKETAFGNINSVVINSTMATKYFGAKDPIGQTLTINGNLDYTVTGVFKNMPLRSDMNSQILILWQDKLVGRVDTWSSIFLATYVTLKPNATIGDANEQLSQLVEEKRPFMGSDPGEMKDIYRMFVQPFANIHLGSTGRTGDDSIGNFGMIYGFIAIAVLILAISAFNYVSLSTARALEREKEICLRKVMGAKRKQIITQVMAESIGQTAIAAFIGLMIVENALPFFGQILDTEFPLSDIFNPIALTIFIIGTIGLGLLAGLYPALFVSGFRPVRYLSSGKAQRAGLNKLRTSLVFIQFTVCIGLIIGAVAISKQINHINDIDMGFNQERLMLLRGVNREETASSAKALKNTIANISGVEAVTRSRIVPLDNSMSTEGFINRNFTRDNSQTMRLIPIDYDFISTYGVKFLAGRELSEQFSNDEVVLSSTATWTQEEGIGNVIINKKSSLLMGYETPEAAIGEQIQMNLDNGGTQPLTIVGVVEDMNFNSARRNKDSLLMYHDPNRMEVMTIRYSNSMAKAVETEVGTLWASMFPNTPIRMQYLEERIESTYQSEGQQLRLFVFFAGLTLLLSLIGLVGLVMNSVTHRTKEISIRRVVGASVGDIIKLFTWQYLKPVLLANVPAWFLAWYFLGNWIENYAQRVDFGASLYLLGGGAILVITMLVVVTLVIRTALTPPVHALRAD